MSENTDWDCPTCGRPTPTEIDVECHCGMMASHHVSISTMCKRLREAQQRESALIVDINEQARLLGMSAERECDLRGKIERLERDLRDNDECQMLMDLICVLRGERDGAQAQLTAERALADRLADALLSTLSLWAMSPKSEEAAKSIAAWREVRGE